MAKAFTREELKKRAFLRAARMMRDLWEEKGSSDIVRSAHSPLVHRSSRALSGNFSISAELQVIAALLP